MGPRDRQEVRHDHDYTISSTSSSTPELGTRKRADSGKGSTLERIFKRRYRSKRSPPDGKQSTIPDIYVESPVSRYPFCDNSDLQFYSRQLLPLGDLVRELQIPTTSSVQTMPIYPYRYLHLLTCSLLMWKPFKRCPLTRLNTC